MSTKLTHSEAYKVLGLKQGASKDEIMKSFRKLVQQHHPDRVQLEPNKQHDHGLYTKICEAKQLLVDGPKPSSYSKAEEDALYEAMRAYHAALSEFLRRMEIRSEVTHWIVKRQIWTLLTGAVLSILSVIFKIKFPFMLLSIAIIFWIIPRFAREKFGDKYKIYKGEK